MSVCAAVPQLTDENLGDVVEAEWGALVLTKSDCGHCARYQAEIEFLLDRGKLGGVAVGKLVLDKPGASQFKRGNSWLSGVQALPYTVIYHAGQRADEFAASKGFYLLERLEGAGAIPR